MSLVRIRNGTRFWCMTAIIALSLAAAARAAPLTIYNTGVDNSGNAWGSAGVPDIHYSLITAPGIFTAQTVVNSYPTPPWIANNSGSRWIAPASNGYGPTGNYVYRTTFNVPNNAILSSVSITGDWATDDPGTDIKINGASTGNTSPGFTSLTPFSVNSGFVTGLNTLDFFVTNVPPFPTPTGLRVDHISGSYQIPEPWTASLTAIAACSLIVMSRRRRTILPRHSTNFHPRRSLMNATFARMLAVFAVLVSVAALSGPLNADPLPGRDLLKFDQEPMVATTIPGTTGVFFGHDELSTAYGDTTQPVLTYTGRFMADDFADKFSTPVVHVKWWGSYIDDNNVAIPPQPHVQKFLIAFESDIPSPPGAFSTPGTPLQWEVVNQGLITANSGTFTEKLIPRTGDPLNEALYEYNAELKVPFAQQPNTVYWLKIAALVDNVGPVLQPIPPGITQWGWHNRDYTINDPLASTAPLVNPGEFIDGTIPGTNFPIWHFQDDSVQGDLQYTPSLPLSQQIRQQGMSPQHYVSVNSNGVGFIDGPIGIEQHSKDLAFRLYTTVPEPASCLLLVCSSLGLLLTRRRRGDSSFARLTQAAC